MGKSKMVFEAIVVGSGVSGGYAAKELTERGLKTLLIERGRAVEHVSDYKTALKNPWEMPHRGRMPLNEIAEYPVMSRVHNKVNEFTSDFFTKDAEHPYVEKKRFDWIRGYQLGGKSLTWGRIALRMSDLDFEANAREEIGIDWPIRYKDLAPWYDRVEKFVGIAGSRDNLPHLPDGVFQPPMPFSCVEESFKKQLESSNPDVHIIHARQAHLTEPTAEQTELGRASCQYRNMCSRGCPFGAYFSTQSATLPAAKKTGNLTIMTDQVVKEVIYDEAKQKATGVLLLNSATNELTEVNARIIFLNASTLGTTQILLQSTSKRFPDGLGNDSGVLGHYLMDHHFGAGATAEISGYEDVVQYGRRPNGFYIPRYQNIGNDKRNYLRGFGYEGNSGRAMVGDDGTIGASLKESYTKFGPWKISLSGFAETLPYEQNRVFLDKSKTDKWDLPLLTIDADYGENEQKMRPDMSNNAAEFFETAGFNNIQPYDEIRGFGRCIHEMGTARMGHSPKDSVLNKHNQVWGAPNVYVTDGACMTSSSCVNPSLTYMALAARAADHAVTEMKRGNV
jgi:choline dehydrogenase-like flavoprotein